MTTTKKPTHPNGVIRPAWQLMLGNDFLPPGGKLPHVRRVRHLMLDGSSIYVECNDGTRFDLGKYDEVEVIKR